MGKKLYKKKHESKEEYMKRRERGFSVRTPVGKGPHSYNCFKDKSLTSFFELPDRQRRLLDLGIVTEKGFILPETRISQQQSKLYHVLAEEKRRSEDQKRIQKEVLERKRARIIAEQSARSKAFKVAQLKLEMQDRANKKHIIESVQTTDFQRSSPSRTQRRAKSSMGLRSRKSIMSAPEKPRSPHSYARFSAEYLASSAITSNSGRGSKASGRFSVQKDRRILQSLRDQVMRSGSRTSLGLPRTASSLDRLSQTSSGIVPSRSLPLSSVERALSEFVSAQDSDLPADHSRAPPTPQTRVKEQVRDLDPYDLSQYSMGVYEPRRASSSRRKGRSPTKQRLLTTHDISYSSASPSEILRKKRELSAMYGRQKYVPTADPVIALSKILGPLEEVMDDDIARFLSYSLCYSDRKMGKGNKGKGGKSRKRGKRESSYDSREIIFAKEGEEYAVIQKKLGNCRMECRCLGDGKVRQCLVRGSMRKKVWVNLGDLVLVSLREYQADVGDIFHRYTPDEVKALQKLGHVPDELVMFEDEDEIADIHEEEEEKGMKEDE
ncbi:Translation initiation factor 1A (eIF-1A) like protein, partial [Aduncisulcus paluster]